MSRIQDILSKAERDGTARRTQWLREEYDTRTVDDEVQARERGGTPASTPPGGRFAPMTAAAPEITRTDAGGTPHVAARLSMTGHAAPAPASVVDAPDPSFAAPPAAPTLDPLLVAALAPASLAAEQYRALRTRLKRAENGRVLRAIAITSPSKGDGKSLTAANLALTMAQEFQERVLLLEADLRRPIMHRLFGISGSPGLADVLMGLSDLDQALVLLPEHHLTVLPAGAPPGQPAELLGSVAMRRVLDTVRGRFDRVLIDVPPVTPLADLHILAPIVDGLLMIVRAGVTAKPAIERALSGLDSSKVLGLVLNEAGGPHSDARDYEGYGYLAG